MKTINMLKALATLVLCLLVFKGSEAQTTDEKDVTARAEALRQAMISGDKSSLENLAADELSYGHSSGKIEGKTEFVDAIVSGASKFRTIIVSDQTVKITDNTAIVRQKLAGETGTVEKPGTLNLAVLLIWQKQKGQWKLLARQATKL